MSLSEIMTIAEVGAGRRGFGYLAKACFGAILYAALFLVIDLPRATVGPELSNGGPLSEAPFFLQLAGGILIGALVLVPLAIASLLTLGYVKLFWRWNWVDEARNPAGMWALRRWFQALVGAFFVAIFAFFFTFAILADPALGGPAATLAALWNANVFGIVLAAILVLFLQGAAAAGLSVESAQRVRVAVRVELIVLLGTLVSRLYLLWRNWEGFLRDSLLGPSVEPWGVIPAELFTMGTFIVLAAAFRRPLGARPAGEELPVGQEQSQED